MPKRGASLNYLQLAANAGWIQVRARAVVLLFLVLMGINVVANFAIESGQPRRLLLHDPVSPPLFCVYDMRLLPIFIPKYVQLRIRNSMDPTGVNHSRRQQNAVQAAAVSHNRWRFGASTSPRSQRRRVFSNQSHLFPSTTEVFNRHSAQNARELGESRIRRTNDYFEQQTVIEMNQDSSKHNISSSFPRFQSPQLTMLEDEQVEKTDESRDRAASKNMNSMSTEGENHELSVQEVLVPPPRLGGPTVGLMR